MSGRDFDPFGSLGPINSQDPTDPKSSVDPADAGGADAQQDPGAAGGGDLAPWVPPARAARSPFTPVPGAPEGRTAREYPTAASAGSGAVTSAAAPVLPAAAGPISGSQPDSAASAVPEGESEGDGAPAPDSEFPTEAEAAPELMFFPAAEGAAGVVAPGAPIGFEAAMQQPAELAEPAEPGEAAEPVAEPGADTADGAEPTDEADAGATKVPTPIFAAANVTARDRGARRWLPYAAAVLIPLLFGGAVWASSGGQAALAGPAAAKPAAEAAAPAAAEEGPIRILAMGDMLPHDSVNQNAVQADGSINFAPFFDGIQPNLAGADATFCNQEVPSAGVDFGISGYPTFNTYAEFSRDLRQGAGCNLVNLATNHTADKGVEGIAATRGQWDALDTLSVSGANRSAEEQNTIQYGEVRGVKTALVSFAEYSNAPIDEASLNLMGDDALVERLLTEARANAQLVIVSAHWGTEDSHDVNEAQRAFAQRVADLGADVVLGTGPHVLQPVEWVPRADGGQTLVWYSLGNMLNTQLEVDQRTGIIASFDVVPGADGGPATVANPSGVLTWMHYDWTAEQEAALQLDARGALSIQPLAASAELLARTTYGTTVEQIAEQAAAILGPVVALSPGV